MKSFIDILIRLVLLPVFVLAIAPLGLVLRALFDPMQLRRNTRPSMLRMAPHARTARAGHGASPAPRNA